MEEKIIKLIKWFLSSFDNHSNGSSGKKLTIFSLVVCVVLAHASWLMNSHAHNNYELLPTVLGIDFGFISLLFGINVTDKKLNGNSIITSIEDKTPTTNIAKVETVNS